LHPLESAAFARRTPIADVAVAKLVLALNDMMPFPLCSVGNENGTARDQNYAEPIWQRKPFTQKSTAKTDTKTTLS
jgi:hypothetical protein